MPGLAAVGDAQSLTCVASHARPFLQVAHDLKQVIETANAPIFGIDANGLINEWNRKAVEITGFSRQEVRRPAEHKPAHWALQKSCLMGRPRCLAGPPVRPTAS